jgi:hypothetical protein
VAFVQRFDSGLRWNARFHVAWLDGVYSWEPGRGEVTWYEDEGISDADVAKLVGRIGDRVRKALKKAGKWWDEDDTGGPFAGSAKVYSGFNGSVLYSVVGSAFELVGFAVCGTGDLNADGFADFAVGAPAVPFAPPPLPVPSVRIFSGVDGSLLRTLPGTRDGFGSVLANVGDVDADGRDDLLIGDPGSVSPVGAAHLVSGIDGTTLLSLTGGFGFGVRVAAAGDMDADGVPDLLFGIPDDSTNGVRAGRVQVLSGATGTVIHDLLGTMAFREFGESIDGLGDIDGDGVPEFIVGTNQTGSTRVYSGATATVLFNLGFADDVASAGDWNGDGLGDFITGGSTTSVYLAPVTATTRPFRAACAQPSTNANLSLTTQSAPAIGTDFVVTANDAGGSAGLAFYFFGFPAGSQTPPLDLAVLGNPGCTLQVDLGLLLETPVGAVGAATTIVSIPDLPLLIGTDGLVLQALVATPGATPVFNPTDTVELVIGSH